MSLSSRRFDSDKLRGIDCQIGRRRERRGLTCRRMYICDGVVSSVTEDEIKCEAIRGSWLYKIPRRYNSWTVCVSIHLPLDSFLTKPSDSKRRGEDKIYLSIKHQWMLGVDVVDASEEMHHHAQHSRAKTHVVINLSPKHFQMLLL